MDRSNGTDVFDLMAGGILRTETTDENKIRMIRVLVQMLEDEGWVCQDSSVHWNHPVVQAVFKAKEEEKKAVRCKLPEMDRATPMWITPRPICLPRNQIYRGWYYRADGTRVEFEQEVKAQGNQGDKADNA